MAEVVAAGSMLLIDSGPGTLKHLHCVVLGPLLAPGRGRADHFVLGCICSRHDGAHYDPACPVLPGDHPFVSHESFVAYRFTRIERVDHVQRMIDSGVWLIKAPCSDALLERMRDGARVSRFASRDVAALFSL